jgi:hypothetical protein
MPPSITPDLSDGESGDQAAKGQASVGEENAA